MNNRWAIPEYQSGPLNGIELKHVANQLRSLLCEYYAAFLEAFPGSSRWTGVSGCLCCPGDRLDSDASCPAHSPSAECCPTTRRPTARDSSCLHSAAASVELAPDLAYPAPDATACAPSFDPARSFLTRIEWHLHAVPSSASGSAPQVFVIDSSRRVSLPRSTRVPLGVPRPRAPPASRQHHSRAGTGR